MQQRNGLKMQPCRTQQPDYTTISTGNMLEAPELGTPRYNGWNVGSQWSMSVRMDSLGCIMLTLSTTTGLSFCIRSLQQEDGVVQLLLAWESTSLLWIPPSTMGLLGAYWWFLPGQDSQPSPLYTGSHQMHLSGRIWVTQEMAAMHRYLENCKEWSCLQC